MLTHDLKSIIEFSKELDVLFIEDNSEVREQITKLLQNFFPKVKTANDGEEAYNIYRKFKDENSKKFDLIISDLSLPKLDGITLCKKILQEDPEQIILVISAHTESTKLINLIEIGIYKFLQKPVDYENFISTIITTINKIKNIHEYNLNLTQIKTKNKELDILSKTDKLTKAKNRLFIDNYLENKLNYFDNNDYISIAMVDIDDFKKINDSYGHLVGDEILTEFSNIIKDELNCDDIIARWGGEEFIIVYHNCSIEEALEKTNKIRLSIQGHTFINDIKLTASFGLAIIESDDNLKSLIQRVDMNMYKSKTLGKNRVT